MTQQEIFDTVAKHILTQGKPARDSVDNCRYRTSDGLKCAVGCLIPDEVYESEMELRTANWIIDKFVSLSFLSKHKYFLDDLQHAHDNPENDEKFMENWKTEMISVAKKYGLNTKVFGEAP